MNARISTQPARACAATNTARAFGARSIARACAALVVALAFAFALAGTFTQQAFALDGVDIKINVPESPHAANTPIPIDVQVSNAGGAYDIDVIEAGLKNIPDELELRGDLKTTYTAGSKVLAKGASTYADVHSTEVQKTVEAQPSAPDQGSKGAASAKAASSSTPKTSDPLSWATLAFAALAAGCFGVYALRRMRQQGHAKAHAGSCAGTRANARGDAFADASSDSLQGHASALLRNAQEHSDASARTRRDKGLLVVAIIMILCAALAALPRGVASAAAGEAAAGVAAETGAAEMTAGTGASTALATIGEAAAGAAAEATATETVECTVTVTIDGKDYKLDGYVAYAVMAPGPAPTPTPTPAPTPETVSIEIEKIWHDELFFDDEGKPLGDYERPESVTVVLTDALPEDWSDNLDVPINEIGKATLTADANGKWAGTIKAPKFGANGQEIDYTTHYLVELPVPDGFKCAPVQLERRSDGSLMGVLINEVQVQIKEVFAQLHIHKLDAATIDGDKIAGATGLANAVFTVFRTDGSTRFITNDRGRTMYEFSAGTYTLEESKEPSGYMKAGGALQVNVTKDCESLTYDAAQGKWMLVYKHSLVLAAPEQGEALDYFVPSDAPANRGNETHIVVPNTRKMQVSVRTNWYDSPASPVVSKDMPQSVKVKLIGSVDGEEIDDLVFSAIATKADTRNSLEATFDVPECYQGEKVSYCVEEDVPEGWYVGKIKGSAATGFVITNYINLLKTIYCTLTWPSASPTINEGLFPRPSGVLVYLDRLVDDEWKTISYWEVAISGTEDYHNKCQFSVHMYNSDGTEAVYRVVQQPLAGYKTAQGTKENNYTIVNEYDSVRVTLTKNWEDDGNVAKKRPETSEFENLVELYQNDVLLSGAKATAIADPTKPNVYTVEWIVPRAGASGDAYTYDVKEKAIAQYVNGEVSGSTANGFAVTNTYAGSMGPSSTDDGVASGSDGEPSGGPTAEPSAGPGGESNENKFDLLVSTDSGRTITVEVTSSNTVLDVKGKILGGISFGDEEIVLWYDCVEKMEDSRTLLSYGITSTVVLHLEWGDSERDKTKAPIERVTPGVGPGGGDVPQLPGFRQNDNAPIAATDGQGEGQGESQGQGQGEGAGQGQGEGQAQGEGQGQGQGQSQGEGQAQGQGQGGAPPAESNNDAGQSNNGSEGNTPDET